MASHRFRYGFKTQAEKLALELRTELGLGPTAPLDPSLLAEHLCIPVLTLYDLEHASPRHVRRLLGGSRGLFSAATIYRGRQRLIITNPAHAETRLANSLCHELGHVVLEHEAEAPLPGVTGGRDWDVEQEREADWLAGCLLITDEAAYKAARAEQTDDEVAANFGVSKKLATWRMRMTGARLRARRARDARAASWR